MLGSTTSNYVHQFILLPNNRICCAILLLQVVFGKQPLEVVHQLVVIMVMMIVMTCYKYSRGSEELIQILIILVIQRIPSLRSKVHRSRTCMFRHRFLILSFLSMNLNMYASGAFLLTRADYGGRKGVENLPLTIAFSGSLIKT